MDGQALLRPVRDGLAQHLGTVRGPQWGAHLHWDADVELQAGFGLDSIELLECAERTAARFALDVPGWEDYLLRDRSLRGWANVCAAALEGHGLLRFTSSGSQGAGHDHEHPLAKLEAEAAQFAGVLGARGRVLVAVPTHHIYGFVWGVLLPHALGVPAIDFCGRLPSTLLSAAQPGDVVVAHPLVWQSLAAGGRPWPADVVGVTSTAPCPPDVIRRLRDAGLARMVEVYGSSETSAIGWRDDPADGFRPLPRWRLEAGADEPVLVDSDGAQFSFPDLIELRGERIVPVGRRDEAVQVAGHNVYPLRIARLLETHPQVASAQVRLDAASARLKAFVVPHEGETLDGDALRAWCAERLASAERPTRFTIGSAQPRNALGKLADWDTSGTADA